jgi:hypothetical protein
MRIESIVNLTTEHIHFLFLYRWTKKFKNIIRFLKYLLKYRFNYICESLYYNVGLFVS